MHPFKSLVFCSILAILFSSNLFATDYYFCNCDASSDPNCVPGNDSNSGTSSISPWLSISKLNSILSTLQGGDRVLFAKGSTWTDASLNRIYSISSTAANPIVFTSYTPAWGASSKPILIEDRAGTNLFNFVDGGNADHDEGYVVKNLDLRGGGTGQWAIFAYNDVDFITLDSLDISNFGIGVHCAGSNPTNVGADGQNQDMKLLNSSITNCSDQGFLGGGDNLLIENCHFENNGFARAILNHNIYLSKGNNVVVRNNELYRSAVINSSADGVSLVVHGRLDNLLIEGNFIHEDLWKTTGNAWGIGVDPGGYNIPEGVTGLVIRNNLIINQYNIGIALTSTPGAIVENNVIINEGSAGFRAIVTPDRQGDADDLVMDKITIRNNSIYLRNGDVFTTAIVVKDEGSQHVIVSNAISIDHGNGLDINLSDTSFIAIDNNMMQLLGAAKWANGMTLNAWTTSSGFDSNSLSGDPEFMAPSSPDFNLMPLSSSIMINAGHITLSSSSDFTGAMRNGTPDIGAYENFELSVENTINSSIIQCYPNPTTDQITVKLDAAHQASSYVVYNNEGKKVLSGIIRTNETTFNVQEFPSGKYIIVIKGNGYKAIQLIKN
jgi:hypothetical protein